jgi:hypothetical protein
VIHVVTDVSRVRGGITLPRWHIDAVSERRPCHYQGPLPLAFPAGWRARILACRDDGLPCARGEPGADGRLCPYREHALISRREHEAWDVLLACHGQVRLAPTGHVVGIDMHAARMLGAARSCDLAVLSELLPAAEAGLVEALRSDRVRNDEP